MPDYEPMTTEQRHILTVVLVPVFMSLLAVSSINVVLPSMQSTLGATTNEIQWVLTGYTLAFGVLLVPGGRAGDLYGRGRLFAAGLALFALGSLISGLAPNGLALDAARIVMGFGSGLLNPQTVGFIQQYFSGARRARAFGALGSIVGVSVAVGPVMGGGLVALAGAEWGWRSTFLINVPIAVAAIVLARYWFPASAWSRPHQPSVHSAVNGRGRPDLDPMGIVLFTLATLMIMITFLELQQGLWVLILLMAGVVLMWQWVRWEKRYRARGGAPMVDLELFRIRSFANGALLIGLYFTGVTSVWVVVAVYLQNGFGFSALQASLIGLPSAFLTVFTSQYASRRVLRTGRKIVVFGMGVALCGLLLTIGVAAGHDRFGVSPWWMLLTLAFIGFAQGFVVSPNQTLSLSDVPEQFSGASGGIMQTGQRVGTAIGTALITTVLFAIQVRYGWDAAFIVAFSAIVLMVLVAGIVAIVDIRGSGEARR